MRGSTMHHIIDPRTGSPVRRTWRTVSVAAASCTDANIATTAALVRADAAPAWLAGIDLPARLVAWDGSVTSVANWPAESGDHGGVDLHPGCERAEPVLVPDALDRCDGDVLLSVAVALGVIDVQRWSTPRWPRFVVDSLHRNVSLLRSAFLVAHILTSVLDSFAPIGLADAFVPFIGSYRPFWLGLGALAFDLIVAVIVSSLLRARMGYTTWRAVHWLTYASWPIALLHGFGTGSDVKASWLLVLSALCALRRRRGGYRRA